MFVLITPVDTLMRNWGSWEIFEFASTCVTCVIPLFSNDLLMNDIQFKESMVQSRAGMYKLFPNICGYVWSGTDDVFGGDNSFCFFWTLWVQTRTQMCFAVCGRQMRDGI